ncbi:MAG: hypothetical protein Kow006_20750 [Gammaproteobacteria bacterium]
MYRVALFPSGRSFFVEPGQTILEAALTAGITLPYQCANGSCGDCRARIVEGRARQTEHSDYVFGGADRERPMLLTCRSTPLSDLVIESALSNDARDIPRQHIETTVRARQLLNDGDILILTLRTPRSNTLRFLAGQQVSLRITGVGQRNKSIASCPCNGRDLQFHFRRNRNDAFSEYLFTTADISSPIEVVGPHGELVFDDTSDRPVILVAYDTGFSAMKSLIEHIISLENDQPIHLYRILPGEEEAYLHNQCRAWADALNSFRFTELRDTDAEGIVQTITAHHDPLDDYDIYMALPDALTQELEDLLVERGAWPERIRFDTLSRG